ncbi:MAG: HAMP domain-containing protein [Opitutae bacterium]|nr:HAMP domain-containing protein [Opitutae bacterium]
MSGGFHFRYFRTRLIVLIAGLLALVQVATYLIVSRANNTSARQHAEESLDRGQRFFREAVAVRIEVLAKSGGQMANDYALRQLLLHSDTDPRTIRSALLNSAERIGAPVVALFTTDGDLMANTREDLTAEHCGPFQNLISLAASDETRMTGGRFASDFAYLDGRLHVLVIVPLYAPYPEITHWFGFASPIDDEFASRIKRLADLDVAFVSGASAGAHRVLATTLAPAMAAALARAAPRPGLSTVPLAGGEYVTSQFALPLLGDDPAGVVLLRSLDVELAPARALGRTILLGTLLGLAVATLAALGLARNLSRPVQQLAAHTRHVAAGDYSQRLDLPRADELGQLATAFNQMTAGLAERDRVRDLLGKVVSPEIATQLLRSDLQLGGEEREVTILFSDLRDFTTLSEKLPPRELLALLNRYLDRMSAIVEKHGGVIDKYIGDAIMALFGAPVATERAAARALAAAREMKAALAELNRELAAEGKPQLALGIGINTGRVVAGNMGSHTRLNYTVIGDGVNLASRLESLTKDASYGTTIIVSEATAVAADALDDLRPLGSVTVKGKTSAVKIFAA